MDPSIAVALISGAALVVGVVLGHTLGRGSAKADRVRAARLESIEHTLRYANAQLDEIDAALAGRRDVVHEVGRRLAEYPWANFAFLGDAADELVDALVAGRSFVLRGEGERRAVVRQLALAKLRVHEHLDRQRMRVTRDEKLAGTPARLTPEQLERRVDLLLGGVER